MMSKSCLPAYGRQATPTAGKLRRNLKWKTFYAPSTALRAGFLWINPLRRVIISLRLTGLKNIQTGLRF
jgi:hypothetical protein